MSREWIDTDAEADAVARDEDAWWNERDAIADHPRTPDPHTDWGLTDDEMKARIDAMAALRKVRNQ